MIVSEQMLKVRKDTGKGQIPLLRREYYLTWLRNTSLELAGFDLSNLNAALEGSMSLHSSVSFSDCLELRDVLSPFKEHFISTDLIPAAPPLCCVSVSEANLVRCIYLMCKHSQDTLP